MEEKKEIVPEEKIEEQEEEKKEEPSKQDFEKEEEVVPANKYNQTLRKQRELEAEKKELEKKLAEKEGEAPKEEEEEKKEEDIFEEEKKPDPAVLIDEKLKPVLEQINKREADNKKKDRTAFFTSHPEYLGDAEKWQTLLDEMDNSLNPNSKDTYYEQLEKAHRIIAGDPGNAEVEKKKTEMAGDVSSKGAQKGSLKEEFTPEERKYQKEWNISDEGMKAYKEKLKSGSMRILT